MDRLYQQLVARIKDNIPAVKFIDWESGQIDAFQEHYPMPFPAIIIDFESVEWTNVGRQVQTGIVTVNLRIVLQLWTDTNSLTPDPVMQQSMDSLKLLNTIHKYIQGFSGEHFNRLDRFSQNAEKRNDGLKVVNMRYHTNLRDAWAMPEETETIATDMQVDITVENK